MPDAVALASPVREREPAAIRCSCRVVARTALARGPGFAGVPSETTEVERKVEAADDGAAAVRREITEDVVQELVLGAQPQLARNTVDWYIGSVRRDEALQLCEAFGIARRKVVRVEDALFDADETREPAFPTNAAVAVEAEAQALLFHSQRRFRSGLAHDVMEPMRPLADAWILDLLERQTFSQHDFVETRQGVCRLAPPLPQALLAMAPTWLERALPLASWLATALDKYDELGTSLKRLRPLPAATPVEERLSLMPRCQGCGVELREYRRKHCADCALVLRDASLPLAIAAGQSALTRARAAGHDPSQSRKARRARGRAVAQRHVEARAWRRTRTQMSEDRKTFQRDVLPVLQQLDVARLGRVPGRGVTADGVSRRA